ncbi:TP53 regulating kinase [Chytridiales sp. JEL 0842]|nr:TP53 regulating kinase [Chytridiales sp. JEL 0842]
MSKNIPSFLVVNSDGKPTNPSATEKGHFDQDSSSQHISFKLNDGRTSSSHHSQARNDSHHSNSSQPKIFEEYSQSTYPVYGIESYLLEDVPDPDSEDDADAAENESFSSEISEFDGQSDGRRSSSFHIFRSRQSSKPVFQQPPKDEDLADEPVKSKTAPSQTIFQTVSSTFSEFLFADNTGTSSRPRSVKEEPLNDTQESTAAAPGVAPLTFIGAWHARRFGGGWPSRSRMASAKSAKSTRSGKFEASGLHSQHSLYDNGAIAVEAEKVVEIQNGVGTIMDSQNACIGQVGSGGAQDPEKGDVSTTKEDDGELETKELIIDSTTTINESITKQDEPSPTNHLQDITQQSNIAKRMGKSVAMLHNLDIIHGDLTTSNMMLRNGSGSLVLIDFGLSYISTLLEDKAVDLYVLEKAMLSTHTNSQVLFDAFLETYLDIATNAAQIKKKLDEGEGDGSVT